MFEKFEHPTASWPSAMSAVARAKELLEKKQQSGVGNRSAADPN